MTTFRRSLSYLARFRWRFLVAMFCSGLVAVTNPGLGFVMKYLVDDVLNKQSTDDLRFVIWLIIVLYVFKGLFTAAARYLMFSVGHLVTFDLRRELYRHMLRLPLSFFERNRTGQIMARSTTDVPVVQGIMIQLHHCVTDMLRVVFSILALVWLSPSLTLTIVLIVPPLYLLIRFISGRLRHIGRQIQTHLGDINSILQETILGIREIMAFCAEDKSAERFEAINRGNLTMNLKGAKYNSINTPALEFLIACAMALVLFIGGRRVLAGELTTGWFLGYLAVLGQLFDPMKRLVDVFNNIKLSIAAFDRVFEFLDEPVTIADKTGATAFDTCRGRVEFRDVTFSYSDAGETVVLQGISFVAEPGRVVAFVGPSGAGKSTLVNLVPRFYDVRGGTVLIDGQDVRDMTVASLRSHFGIVPQETILFSGTVAENIVLGRPEASRDEVEAAARAANAHGFISELPEGYDTQIGERGTKLSGGQRQRIAIARAILRDPRILILDEATSSLDTDSEQLVQDALDRLMKNRTTLVIAHRLSTITSADSIIVLDRGRVAETGTHQELLKAGGLYAKLCRAQFQAA